MARSVDLDLFDVSRSTQRGPYRDDALVCNPVVRTSQRMVQAFDMRLPRAEVPIEIVAFVAGRAGGCRRRRAKRSAGRRALTRIARRRSYIAFMRRICRA